MEVYVYTTVDGDGTLRGGSPWRRVAPLLGGTITMDCRKQGLQMAMAGPKLMGNLLRMCYLQSVLFFATFKEQLTGIHVRRSTEDAAVTVCLSGSRKARQIIVHRVLPLPAPGAKVLG